MKTILAEEKQQQLGIGSGYNLGSPEYKELVNYANLKLATLGLPTVGDQSDNPSLRLSGSLVKEYREKVRRYEDTYVQQTVEYRIFLPKYFGTDRPSLPTESFVLDRHGLARVTSYRGMATIFPLRSWSQRGLHKEFFITRQATVEPLLESSMLPMLVYLLLMIRKSFL